MNGSIHGENMEFDKSPVKKLQKEQQKQDNLIERQ